MALTHRTIKSLYDKGVKIKIKRDRNHHSLQGVFDPATLEAIIWRNNCCCESEIAKTIIHELIHARDYLFSPKKYDACANTDHPEVDEEAKYVYENRPSVYKAIRKYWNLNRRGL